MRIVETIVNDLSEYLKDKTILEIACGDSDFSIYTSKYANEVLATDISLERLNKKNLKAIPQNIEFKEMDASNLNLDNNLFDLTVCYNALAHLENNIEMVLLEMTRVTKKGGLLFFVITWKIDKRVIPRLKKLISINNNLKLHFEINTSKYINIIVKKIL